MDPAVPNVAARAAWRRARQAEERLIAPISHYAVERWGRSLLAAAIRTLRQGQSALSLVRLCPVFDAWFALIWLPRLDDDVGTEPREWPTSTIGLSWLTSGSASASAFEQAFILAASEATYSLHLVEAVTPGWSLALRDLLTGRLVHAVDPEIADRVRRGEILMSGVLTLDGVSTLLAPAPWTMPAGWCLEAEDMRRLYSDEPWQQPEELIGVEFDLFEVYQKAMDRPFLLSAEGEPGDLLHLEWAVSEPFGAALDRLRSFSVMEEEECFSLEMRPDGAVRALITWYEPHPDEPDDYALLGNLFLDEGLLSAEVAAGHRAELASAIETRFGAAASLVTCRSARPIRIHERRSRFIAPVSFDVGTE